MLMSSWKQMKSWSETRSDYQEAISFARSIGFRPVSVKPENRAEDKQENRPEDKKERQEVLWMRHEREQAAPE